MSEPTDEEKRDRLDHMIAYLEKLQVQEPESFDLSYWAAGASSEELKRAQDEWVTRHERGEPLNCNTTACLVGHMVVAFPGKFAWDIGRTNPAPWGNSTTIKHVVPTDGTHSMVDPKYLEEFFGGEPELWEDIIYVENYRDDDEEDEPDDGYLAAAIGRAKALRVELYGDPAAI